MSTSNLAILLFVFMGICAAVGFFPPFTWDFRKTAWVLRGMAVVFLICFVVLVKGMVVG